MTHIISNPQHDAAAERIMNAASLGTAQRYLRSYQGFSLIQTSADENQLDYKLLFNGELVADELCYCAVCKRALVDTSYCDGCDTDEERSFYESDF